jgi:beta-xylosidase
VANTRAGILGPNSFDHIGYEGMFLFKANGRYYASCSEMIDGRYSCLVATSKNIYGPYSERYEAIPNGGHNTFFQDEKGHWWSTYFGPPWFERAAILPMEFAKDGRLRPQPELIK